MRIIITLISVLCFLILYSCSNSQQTAAVDLAITNALIIDGSGKEAYNANLYIAQNRIVAIDTTLSLAYDALETIDAMGKTVTPGFIDLHSHGNPLTHGDFKNYLAMGVTTITLGQDGYSPKMADLAVWRDSVEQQGIAPNIAMFIGHGTLREMTGIGNSSAITTQQLAAMTKTLKVNLPYIFGMSTGLEYAPALFAEEKELLALAREVGKAGKMIMSHMRNEDDNMLFDTIRELLAQGQFARVHIAHLKSVYGKGAARAEEILKELYAARARGIKISADVYPYIASYTGIAIVFPDWAKTNEQLKRAIKNRREELEKYIVNKVNYRNGPESTLFGTEPYKGKTLKQVAAEMKLPFEQVLIDSIGPEGASAAYFVMNKELQYRLISDSLIAVSSDGSPTSFHPRGHGTFAKLIEEFVVKNRQLSLPEAVRKVSGMPASILGLKERGEIKIGNWADINIFDPLKVKAIADYGNPHQLAEGFDFVLVNGHIAVNQGMFSNTFYGKVLNPDPLAE